MAKRTRVLNVERNVPGGVEGRFTRTVEMQTSRIPSISFLAASVVGIIGSAILSFVYRRRELGNFVGLWVPTILIVGLYNKVVKLERELIPEFEHEIGPEGHEPGEGVGRVA